MKTLFGRLFGKRSENVAQPRRRTKARPSIEGLEDRLVMTNYWLGNYTPPGWSYTAGTQRVVYWAEEVGGSFTASNASAAWTQAMGLELHSHGTLSSTADVLDRTTSSHFLLVGWENTTTQVGGWIAARYNHSWQQLVVSGPWYNQTTSIVTHSSMDWMSNGNQGRTNVEGPFTMNYNTNGYTVGLYISPDSSGNMHGSFTTPH